MQINWKVRIKNKQFWLAIIPATLLLAQAVAAILGIVTDPTTRGIGDSGQAMGYDAPREG